MVEEVSLDGLILKSDARNTPPYYIAFRIAPPRDTNQKVLYTWEKYDTKTFNEVGVLPEELKEILDNPPLNIGFTAQHIRGRVLEDGPSRKELTEKELKRVAKQLKSRYPKLYEGIEFKRTIKL